MRVLTSLLTQAKNQLSSPAAVIPLLTLEIDATTTLRLAAHPTTVVFRGDTYGSIGLEIDEATQDAKGGLHDLSVSVSNVTREVSAYLEVHDLRGKRVTIQYVQSANLADDDAVFVEERYEIMSVHVKGSTFVMFRLGHDRISQHQFPAGRFLRDSCRWIYKSTECGYTGAIPSCTKVLEGFQGCRDHHNVARFGAYPLLTPVPGRQL
ncbi:MAG: hypothetical protein JSR31_05935 [Nitrospira sp.]|nr:hypothetical protein [Nitrospira sp.]